MKNQAQLNCRSAASQETDDHAKEKLLEWMPRYGWKVASVDVELRNSAASDWFVDELWEVESSWSPTGLKLWVTFLVDPQTPNLLERKKGQGVYAIKAARRKPTGWWIADDEVGLYLNRGWENLLAEFFDQLSALRQQ